MLIYIIVALLIALIALLWYAVRTHKTPAELEAKINDTVDVKLAAMKAETAQAVEAAKGKLDETGKA